MPAPQPDPAHPGAAAPRSRVAAGILYILASALCFGSMPFFARRAYAAGVDLPTLLMLRFSIAGTCMWLLFALRGLRLPRGGSLALLLAMGGLGYAGQAFCYFKAITLASVGLVSLLLYLYPALVALLSWAVLRHRLSGLQVAAVAIALAGSALTVGRAGDGTPLGIGLGLLAAVVYSIYILVGSRIPAEVSPTASTAVITSTAALVFAAMALARGPRLPAAPSGWWAVLAVALVSTVLAILFFFEGLERVGPVRASVYSTLEPIFTVTLAAVLLGEPFGPARIGGGLLIVGAVLLLAREELRAARTAAGPQYAGTQGDA